MVANFQKYRMGFAGMLVGAALTGWLLHGENEVNAEVRKATPAQPEQHFKSGGRLSEGVLQEILVVLKRMDERLARIESVAQVPSRGGALQSVPTTETGTAIGEDRQAPDIKVRRSK